MFKKIVLAALMAFSVSAFAAERITILWGFAPGANQGVFYRALAAEANKIQDKYEFLFEAKPGAGGAIAARYVLANPKNNVLGATSTFFIRANFDKETGYDLNQFQPVLVQTLHSPLALFSTKYNKMSDLKGGTEFTVSISGYGSHSNLLANSLTVDFSLSSISIDADASRPIPPAKTTPSALLVDGRPRSGAKASARRNS